MPVLVSVVLLAHGLLSSMLGFQTPSGPDCQLEAAPARLRTTDTLTIRYLFTRVPFPLSSGHVRMAEEVFGHSLSLRPRRGAPLRFQRTPAFHYIASIAPDSVIAGRMTYEFRFPPIADNARLIESAKWFDPRQSPGRREAVFEGALIEFLPGTYTLTATLELEAVAREPLLGGIRLHTVRLECRPAVVEIVP